MGLLRAHRARRGACRDEQGLHRSGERFGVIARANCVQPFVAQLPAAVDCGRFGAGGTRDCAGGNTVVLGTWFADY